MVALAMAGCVLAPVQDQGPMANVTGDWAGEWVCNDPALGKGVAAMKLVQSGTQVTGSVNVTIVQGGMSRSTGTDKLRGTVSGDTFLLQQWETLNGGFTVAGDRMSGQFEGVMCRGKLAATRGGAAAGYGLRAATVDYVAAGTAGLPPGAKPGECYVQVVVAAQYETVKERVLKKAASTKVEVVAAQFQEVDERVVVRPAAKRLEAVAPQYEDIEERILVQPASKRLEPVAATFRTETERVLIRPASMIWKRSSELTPAERAQQKVDLGAGDILCLVEVPAEYATVTREVVDRPATTREVEVPAEWRTMKKTVLKTPATVREVEVPAEYSTVKVKKMIAPAREVKTEIPAQYDQVTKQTVKTPASVTWREVLCETNATPQTLQQIQRALKRAGFDPGREDGRYDAKTEGAVRAFQQARSLPVDSAGYINMATVKALGVTL
jgi:hypothetical protein